MTVYGKWLFIVVLICGSCFSALVVQASRQMGLVEGFRSVLTNPWGMVAMFDLYMGLLFVALWMGLLEKCWWKRMVWIVALFLLGNGITALYLALRLWRMKSPAKAVFSSNTPILSPFATGNGANAPGPSAPNGK